MRIKSLILLLVFSVACFPTHGRFSPRAINRGEAKIIAQEQGPSGNYLVTSGFVRKFYDDCVRFSGDRRHCEARVYALVVAENMDGTFWVKPAMVKEFQKKKSP